MSFGTEITRDGESLIGPWREPAQMLAEQDLGGHTSVHDDATAAKLGLAGAPIEGPTHFSQIDPLAVDRWGPAWFERGCVSSHFLNMVVEGEQVRATLTSETATLGRVVAEKGDGTPVLTATVSLGSSDATELDERASPWSRRPRAAVHRGPARDRDDPDEPRAGDDGVRRAQRCAVPVHARPEARPDHRTVFVVRRRR